MLPLTKIDGVPDKGEIIRGMAYFAGTGPFERHCRECEFFGYMRVSKKDKLYRTSACLMFKKLTGKYGPRFDKMSAACKYFNPKKKADATSAPA